MERRGDITARSAPLGFGDRTVPVPSHLCLFYYDDEELKQRLGFLKVALEDDTQCCVLFGRRSRIEEVLGYLAAAYGRDIESDLRDGRVILVEGHRDAAQVMANIGGSLDKLVARDVKLIRFLGFIGWDDPEWPAHEDLLEFESKVNAAVTSYPAIVICTYDMRQLPGPLLIFGGIQTHPFTIIGDTVCENPHYVSTDAYLASAKQSTPWLEAGREKYAGVRIGRIQPDLPDGGTPPEGSAA